MDLSYIFIEKNQIKVNQMNASEINLHEIKSCAENAALKAATEILRLHNDGFLINEKGPANLVTEADLLAEKTIIEQIKLQFPTHSFLGEEAAKAAINEDNLWVIDPIDGTNNFAHGIPHIGISIAYCQKGIPVVGVVYQPFSREMFSAIKNEGATLNDRKISVSKAKNISESVIVTGFHYDFGSHITDSLKAIEVLIQKNCHGIRRFGAASMDLCYVACGRFDGYYELKLCPWDFAAGMLIVKEAGGITRNLFGEELTLNDYKLIATNPQIYEELKEILTEVGAFNK